MYMMLYTLFGSIPLLFGLIYLSGLFNRSRFVAMGYRLIFDGCMPGVWALVLLTAFLVKTPIYYFHLWLPKAHVEAPMRGSMVLAGILLKLGSYGLMRLVVILSGLAVNTLLMGMIWFVFVGGLAGGLVAISQSDGKSLVAYSSISHMGLLTGGLLRGRVVGLLGGFIVVLSHGLVSSFLFYLVGVIYSVSISRVFAGMFGLFFILPFIGYAAFIGLSANFRVPPFLRLVGELRLLAEYLSLGLGSGIIFVGLRYYCAVFCVYLFIVMFLGKVGPVFVGRNLGVGHYFCGLIMHLFPFALFLFAIKGLMATICQK